MIIIKYKNPKGEFVGRIINNVYYTERKPHHFMRIFQGFGISKYILEDLAKKNVKDIVLTYIGINGIKTFKTSLLNYINSKKIYTDKTMGPEDLQLFVSIKDMEELI